MTPRGACPAPPRQMPAARTGRYLDHVAHIAAWEEVGVEYVEKALATGIWPTDEDFDGGDFDRFNEQQRPAWAGIDPPELRARLDDSHERLVALVRRLSLATIRSDAAWGWVYLVLHGHVLDHLGVLEPWADQLRARQIEGDPFAVDGEYVLTDADGPIERFWAAEGAILRQFDGLVRALPLDAWELERRHPRMDAEGPRRAPGGLVRGGAPTRSTRIRRRGRLATRTGRHRRLERSRGGARSPPVADGGPGAVRERPAPPRGRHPGAAARRSPRSGRLELGLRGPPRPRPGPPRDGRSVVRARRVAAGRGARVTKAPDEAAAGSAKATPAARPVDALSIEHIVGTEAPREFRLDPRGRVVAYTLEYAGGRQLFTQPVRGGPATQVTASEKNVSDPQWSPDGRRLAFVRDGAISIVDGGRRPARDARPSPGRQIGPALVARRQACVVHLAAPRLGPGVGRGRARAAPRPAGGHAPAGTAARDHADRPRRRRVRVVA